ncbi:MAG: NTP transferase domain-containing protein [Chloroflexi bacterium]|nr:NTP transferase domain-containing protein [Chloroflexota bacterium]
MQDVLAIVLAGGMGSRLSILASERAKPAVPFGGRYRVIDFTLSNCVNSGVRKVGVITQYAPRTLAQHLGDGRPWGLDYPAGQFTVLQPYLTRTSGEWYKGTADAIYQNIGFIEGHRVKQVLVLAGDHVYAMRYDPMMAYHRENRADITVGVIEMPLQDVVGRFGALSLDDGGMVVDFEEKPVEPKGNLASMGIYIFNKDVLTCCLEEDARDEKSQRDIGRNIIPASLGKYRVAGYKFAGYWRDVGTVEAYWQANMDLIVDLPPLNLYDEENPIRSGWYSEPPAKHGPQAAAGRSLVSSGCIINGKVWNSILSPRVYIEDGAEVSESVLFEGVRVGKGAVLHRCIVDEGAWIGPGSQIGWGEDYAPNREEPDILTTGITLIGQGAKVPVGVKVGRNCKVAGWAKERDFISDYIPSGSSVGGGQAFRQELVCPA